MPAKSTTMSPCLTCGDPVAATASRRKLGKGRYCSNACRPDRRGRPAVLSPDRLTALIPLCDRSGAVKAHAVIDVADASWASQWRWTLSTEGYATRGTEIAGKQLTIRLHRELLGLPQVSDGRDGDHIDRDRLNCRRENLRIVPSGKNQQNISSIGRTSVHRGVSWQADRSQWRAVIQVSGKRVELGSFDTEDEAAEAARVGRQRHMPFAVD